MKTLALKIGIAIPILLILIIIGLIYIPMYYIKPHYNFLYATGGNYYWQSVYAVKNGQIINRPINISKEQSFINEQLYVYDVNKNKTFPINFVQAQKWKLDPSPKSPDGFLIVNATNSGGFFPLFILNAENNNVRYLQKNSYSKKLNLKLSGSYYNNFYFIGWILDGKTTITQ